jgi:hypothetical protein
MGTCAWASTSPGRPGRTTLEPPPEEKVSPQGEPPRVALIRSRTPLLRHKMDIDFLKDFK